jgi:solute carrier family 25 2-oxodicarboxylate transporter 21
MSLLCAIKTRLQLKGGVERYKSMFNAYGVILKEEGFAALYKGAIPRMVVVGPLFGITLLAFETQKNYMIRNGML